MIKILIDSGCDIDQNEAKKLGITVLPFEVRFKDEAYLDGVNLNHKQFFEKLIESDELPKTSLINSFTFEEKFEELTKDGSQVLCICISSKLSGTYANAKTASKNFKNVFVIDSLNACVGERVLLELALRMVAENKTVEEIVDILNEKKKKINVLALLGTLKYLKKGGRISPLVAFAGEMFSVKPVVAVKDGEVKLVGKAMGSKKGNNLLTQLVDNAGGIDYNLPYCVAYSGLDDTLLNKYIQDSAKLWEGQAEKIPSYMIGCTIGTHVGPGAIAVCFFGKE